jgi:hypothetical protein
VILAPRGILGLFDSLLKGKAHRHD